MPLDNISAYSARQELVAINELIAAAQEAHEVAHQGVHRFERPAAEVQIARAELAALKSVHDTEIASWYEAGCSGDHPQTPLELLRLEHQVGELACNVGAVENRLAEAHEALQRENVHLGQLQLRHRSVLYRAVTEAAQARLYTKAVPALINALSEFAVIESLATKLRNH